MENRCMEMEMEEKSLGDYADKFNNSLNEFREFRSQLYNAADFWKSSFFESRDKKCIVESTKDYISEALLVTIDHLGCLSANLQSSLRTTDSLPRTQHRIQTLKQRIGTWKHYSYKLGLPKPTAPFPRYHCRYISVPLGSTAFKDSRIKNSESCIDVEGSKQLEYLHTLLPVEEDRVPRLTKSEHSSFQFQKAQKPKRETMNWKRMQKKEIGSVFKRAKQMLA